MTTLRRFHGFSADPPAGPQRVREVSLAIDDEGLHEWSEAGEETRLIPLGALGDWRVELSRRWFMSAEVGGITVRWTAADAASYDEFTEDLRRYGADIRRPRRGLRTLTFVTGAALILASIGTFVAYAFRGSSTPATPVVTSATVGAVNLRAIDLPSGWSAVGQSYLSYIAGSANQVVTPHTKFPPLTGASKQVWDDASANFQSCMHTTAHKDRMFGSSGQQPALQVTGETFGSTSFGGGEQVSLTQYYATTTMVRRDLREYRAPQFGRCWGIANAQILLGFLNNNASYAMTTPPVTSWHVERRRDVFLRTSVVTVALPGGTTPYYLATAFAARGHYEVNYFALVGNWTQAQATVDAGLNAVLSRMAPGSTTPARA